MGLTVTEKEHWKNRITKRIDKKIESIYAEDPNLKERIEREARERALASLKLTDLQQRLDEIELAKEELVKEQKRLHKAQLATVRGVAVEDLDEDGVSRYHHGYGGHNEVDGAIERRQAVHADELMVQDERGRIILNLREEKDNLLDTIWLATSPRDVKQLWSKVAELLATEQTQLEREALAIEPVDDK